MPAQTGVISTIFAEVYVKLDESYLRKWTVPEPKKNNDSGYNYFSEVMLPAALEIQEAQLMLTTGSTRL